MPQNGPSVDRRRFLQATSLAALGAWGGRLPSAAAGDPARFNVGVGHNPVPYFATVRAIATSGDWNPEAIAGKRVVIKPNLVQPATPESGTVTDAEVVRAIADLSLQAGASEVWIIEAGPDGANFEECGYGFFADYDPLVSLVDITNEPATLTPVANGLASREIWMPSFLFEENVYLISAAKMKVHKLTQVTLATKNIFGIPPLDRYEPPGRNGRFALHDRSLNESVADLNQARPFDFAVVDAIWAMEGTGPWGGDPVRLDLVFAGANPVAVDRVCLMAMGIPQARVQHLTYATLVGLGPGRLLDVNIRGDSFVPREFALPDWLPTASYPLADPAAFNPSLGESTTIEYNLQFPCETKVEIVQGSPHETVLTVFRQLQDWLERPPGTEVIPWDGRDDDGQIVPPGSYGVRVAVRGLSHRNILYSFGWVDVLA
ncbi:MAG: DUF362 domain-containing protein [Ardenticatenaceae bacterium]